MYMCKHAITTCPIQEDDSMKIYDKELEKTIHIQRVKNKPRTCFNTLTTQPRFRGMFYKQHKINCGFKKSNAS